MSKFKEYNQTYQLTKLTKHKLWTVPVNIDNKGRIHTSKVYPTLLFTINLPTYQLILYMIDTLVSLLVSSNCHLLGCLKQPKNDTSNGVGKGVFMPVANKCRSKYAAGNPAATKTNQGAGEKNLQLLYLNFGTEK